MPEKKDVKIFPALVSSIGEQLGLILGDQDQVKQDCDQFSALLSHPPSTIQKKYLKELALLLTHCDDFLALPVSELLTKFVSSLERPWPILKIMLHAEEEGILQNAIQLALDLVGKGSLSLNRPLLLEMARLMELEYSPFEDDDLRDTFLSVLAAKHGTGTTKSLLNLLRKDADHSIRNMAAILLDRDGNPATAEASKEVLGPKAYGVLAPYLDYTRANYQDLFAFSGGSRITSEVFERFAEAGTNHGEALVREVVATLGWSQVSQGIQIDHLFEVIVPGNLPLFVTAVESQLFVASGATIGSDCYFITCHGGTTPKQNKDKLKSDPVDQFRQLNITHAEILGDLLDVAPLNKAKVERITAYLDNVVKAYVELFSATSDECRILPEVWLTLRTQVMACMARESHAGTLSAELTRLMLAFEEPANLGEVRTVHGLKRYLHQKGLKLGFEMVDTAHASNRTVDLMLVDKEGTQVQAQTIRYAEFEGGTEKEEDPWLPYPVQIVVDGLARQLLYGTKSFPSIGIFIFGNEVHYYISFRNHPAFLRVDFSPPQRGGMLDLEYYGVSNYELDVHPNLNLDAIQSLYRQLEFDVKIEGTRLFVRYDKERSNSLGDLCDHVAALFRLAPFLMDFDWVIGSLQLPQSAREIVTQQWIDRFCRSGVMPMAAVLNEKRSGILIKCADGPTGKEEVIWAGGLPYVDPFTRNVPAELGDCLKGNLEGLRIPVSGWSEKFKDSPWSLLELEKEILEPIREALTTGQIESRDGCLHPAHPDLFQMVHEAEYFAVLLAGSEENVAAAALLGRPLAELERFVKFVPTGFVGGLVVEKAKFKVRGGQMNVFAARDSHGVLRLGATTLESRLVRSRSNSQQPWESNAITDATKLWELMRSANYLAMAPSAIESDSKTDLAELRSIASLHRPVANRQSLAGESLLYGLKAAPGRSVGRALFGTEGRKPRDMKGAILVAREVRPEDNQFLSRSAGIISTGGAVLSHAALLAIQFGKPAMVTQGLWHETDQGSSLSFSVTVYREMERLVAGYSVCIRVVENKRTDELVENDLVILDANEGVVQVLGQHRDTLALWDGLHLLGEASRRAGSVRDDMEILEIRAQQLRARHQIQKILDRLTDPVLTAFAVEEIVVGETLSQVKNADKKRLLSQILGNNKVNATARTKLGEICLQLADRCRDSERTAREQIPTSDFLYEVLGLRLRSAHWYEAYDGAVDLLNKCGMGETLTTCYCHADLSGMALKRLEKLRLELLAGLETGEVAVRHLLRRIGRIGHVLRTAVPQPEHILEAQEKLAATDLKTLKYGHQKRVLASAQCGLESHPQIGWKAANLAEIDRLAGVETVPQWFAVTNASLKLMESQPVVSAEFLSIGIQNLGAAIRHILGQDDTTNKAKSQAIKVLWANMKIPEDLHREVLASYADIVGADPEDSFVAVRSSSCDEDTETVMRAGEFETFLYVQGRDSLLKHLLLTWSGLWTERALYTREAAGTMMQWPTGGLIVQRMVRSRVSGVLQTVNVARGDLREMLVNVGLGLGEGIVSGLVAADLITVVKDFPIGDDPVHINYLTNDKPQQMVFDDLKGKGTRLQDTLYHQRLRPALEYTELCEIVAKASILESVYGYPLDIEFALEGTRLWLLQARPIATFSAEFRKTVEEYPLNKPETVVHNQEC